MSCRLGTAAYVKCSKTHTYTALKQGPHTFTVRAVSGGTTRTAVYKWTVDSVVPTAPSVSGGSDVWTKLNVPISATGSTDTGGSGIASYQYRTSADAGLHWSTPGKGNLFTVATTGTTWVQFRGVDKAGNVSPWAPAAGDPAGTAVIDKVLPTVPGVAAGAGAWSKAASTTVTPTSLSTDAGGSGLGPYEFRTSADDGASWTATTAGSSTVISAEGKSVVEFRSSDLAGNRSAWSSPVPVWLDRTAPVVTITGGSANWTNAATVHVAATAADAGADGSTIVYRTSTNGTTWSATTPGSSVDVTALNKTYVEFQATDGLGNASAWPGSAPAAGTVMIDRTAPSNATSVTGGSTSWQDRFDDPHCHRRQRHGRIADRPVPVPHLDRRRNDLVEPTGGARDDHGRRHDTRPDARDRQRRQRLLEPGSPPPRGPATRSSSTTPRRPSPPWAAARPPGRRSHPSPSRAPARSTPAAA